VTTGSGENKAILGGGRNAAFGSKSKRWIAEVAFTVEENYQG
jgi:hypothetical protein